LLLLKPKICT